MCLDLWIRFGQEGRHTFVREDMLGRIEVCCALGLISDVLVIGYGFEKWR